MFKFFSSVFTASIAAIGLIVVALLIFVLTTPRPTNIKQCLTTKFREVRLCPGENGYLKLSEISKHARNAVVVSEDAAFYDHRGFDWHELQASVEKNWEKGEWARGGSTITQQLAKNVYLSADKSLLRKLREAMIVVQLERSLTKDEILEKYLNVVEFGKDLYGIGNASRYYFKKPASQLTPAEGAFLAFLLPSPVKYSVSFHKKSLTPFARAQTREIVRRLGRFKRIGEEEVAQNLAQVDVLFGSSAPAASDIPDYEVEPSAEESGDAEYVIPAFPYSAPAPEPTEVEKDFEEFEQSDEAAP